MYLARTKYTLSSRLPKDGAKDTVDDTPGLCTVHIVQQAGYEQPNLPTDDPRHTEDDQHGPRQSTLPRRLTMARIIPDNYEKDTKCLNDFYGQKKDIFSYPPTFLSFTLSMVKFWNHHYNRKPNKGSQHLSKADFNSADSHQLAVIILSTSVYKLSFWSDRSARAALFTIIKDNLLKILSFNGKRTKWILLRTKGRVDNPEILSYK